MRLFRRLIAGFKDPARRPRFIMWTGTGVFVLAVVVVAALGVTSTNWFCAVPCHVVQADTITSFERSSHSTLWCLSCHVPINQDPVSFVIKKVTTLPKLYKTVAQHYSQPLNADSSVALDQKQFGTEMCTQCHDLAKRTVTPSPGIIMDHAIHDEDGIHCTVCHNRVAHVQDFELVLRDPNTGEPSYFHENFMEMTACYRCHTLTGESVSGIVATGACEACHTPDFDLIPANHDEPGFYELYGDSSGHAEMAREDYEALTAARAELPPPPGPDATDAERMAALPPVAAVGYCQSCHIEREFCDGCHGVEIPHPEGFAEDHVAPADANPASCALCHNETGDPALNATNCDQCHHPAGDPRIPWLDQHDEVSLAPETDIMDCYQCHTELFCSGCHVRGVAPSRY
ncbi:MAG TPA: NapC/NirT family cytochrome c [Coriobacteriia bacterium]|nr:NapC/NirT family cytochrome c [Coriobacteriia bacterium]